MSCVNRELASIFIHNPKCAGSSMEALPWVGGGGHKTIYDYRRRRSVKLDAFFKWGFVRNPWERLVSLYHATAHRLGYEFPDLVDELWSARDSFAGRINFRQTDILVGLSFCFDGQPMLHLVPQHLFFEVDGELCMDFIGRFENLQADFGFVCAKLGQASSTGSLGQASALEHQNSSEHGPYRNYYDRTRRDQVADLYARDLELFRYDF